MSKHIYKLSIKNTDRLHDIEGSPKPLVLDHIESVACNQECTVQRFTTSNEGYTLMIITCPDDTSNKVLRMTFEKELEKYEHKYQY